MKREGSWKWKKVQLTNSAVRCYRCKKTGRVAVQCKEGTMQPFKKPSVSGIQGTQPNSRANLLCNEGGR